MTWPARYDDARGLTGNSSKVYADIVDKARENPAKYLTGLLG